MDSYTLPSFPIAIAHRNREPIRTYRRQISLDHRVLPTNDRFCSVVLDAAFLQYRRAAACTSTWSAYRLEQPRSWRGSGKRPSSGSSLRRSMRLASRARRSANSAGCRVAMTRDERRSTGSPHRRPIRGALGRAATSSQPRSGTRSSAANGWSGLHS